MARRDQYIKSKSNYILRKKHAVVSTGTIFEDDQLTIVPDDGLYDDDRAVYTDSNFKFRVRTDINEKKKHFSGNWLLPDNSEKEYWTGENCSSTTITDETRIRIKPDYSSMKDFAYYGSAEDLVKATVRDVLLKYPAGIYYLNDEHRMIDGKYVVSNEFNIDIWTPFVEPESVENPLRYLSASFGEYLVGTTGNRLANIEIDSTGSECPNTIVATTKIGNNVFYTYLTDEGEHVILCDGTKERGYPVIHLPYSKFVEEFDKLDDFSKVLLNLDSKPLFKSVFETPYFDGQGYYTTKMSYTWPSVATENFEYFTPDTTSPFFAAYVSKLLAIAKFHDEYDSDNMWRMLTHRSIKNMDWTFTRKTDGSVEDLSNFDSSRMKAVMELCGRQFDDLKRYADNIKYTNTITYDEKNNLPDYFLTDAVENDGWDAYHVGPSADNAFKSEVLYTGSTLSGKTSAEANISFMRRLSINSDYIQSMKGTKRGVETILGMFGMENEKDYSIEEYIAIADKFPLEDDMRMKLPYYDNFYYDDDIYSDWPVAVVDTDFTENYMIPWFSKNGKYASGLYFQQKGGWENTLYRNIDLPITAIGQVTSTGDLDVYGETLQYMRYAVNIDELISMTTTKLFEETVCYVEDISDILNGYEASPEDEERRRNGGIYSHYFILKNPELSSTIGYVDNEFFSCYGWRNIFENEYDGSDDVTCDGMRVLYLESLKTIELGNNPHIGYGFYDMGEDFLDHFRHVFKSELENGKFSMLNDIEEGENLREEAWEIGFGACTAMPVTAKTLSFIDETEKSARALAIESGRRNDGGYYSARELQSIGAEDDEEWSEIYGMLNNPEGGSNMDEAAAFSIINTKRIKITFNSHRNEYLRKYIEDVVLKYVEQMMPATAIFSYEFDDDRFIATPITYGMTIDGGFYRAVGDAVYLNKDNNNYMVEEPGPEVVQK